MQQRRSPASSESPSFACPFPYLYWALLRGRPKVTSRFSRLVAVNADPGPTSMEPPNVDIEGHEWSRLTSQSLCRTFAHPSLDLKRDQGDKDGCKDHNRDQRSSTQPLDHPGRGWNFQVLFSGGGDPQQHTCIYFLCVFFWIHTCIYLLSLSVLVQQHD